MDRRKLLETAISANGFLDALASYGPLAMDLDLFASHAASWAADETGALHAEPWTQELAGGEPTTLRAVDAAGAAYLVVESVRGQSVAKGARTAIIPIVGPITPFALPEWMERYGIRVAALPKIVASARAAANDPDVGRILYAIHSPGGSVYGMPEAVAALREVSRRKKTVASINYLGASAGYWLAAAQSEIVATPSALIGSVGAAIRHVSFARMAEMEGVDVTDISLPESKRDVTEFKVLSETGRSELTRIVSAAYDTFKADISVNRRLDFVKNGEQYGRVVPASDALGLNLIDRVVTFDTVLGEGPAVDLPTQTRRAQAALLKRKNPDA